VLIHPVVPPVPSHPYSRSHARREKRKTRPELSGGHLRAVAAALSEAIGETDALPLRSLTRVEREEEKRKREDVRRDGAKIGMGKGRTLGEKARRKEMLVFGMA